MDSPTLALNKVVTEQPIKGVAAYESVHDIEEIKDEIDSIASEILRITLLIKHKNIKDINKNFQATLTNYFLECQVCQLLTKPMNVQYKRDVRKVVEATLNKQLNQEDSSTNKPISPSQVISGWEKNKQTLKTQHQSSNITDHHHQNNIMIDTSSTKSNNRCFENAFKQNENTLNQPQVINGKRRGAGQNAQKASNRGTPSQYVKKEKTAKYIMLIGIYGDFIDSFGLQNEYIEILLDNIKNNQNTKLYTKDSQKYITLYQKKLCAILVLQHYLCKDERMHFKSFCDLWNSVFLNHKLFYFARETNIFYNKIKINDLIEGYNSNAENKVNKQKKQKCKLSNTNFYQQDSHKKKQKSDNSCLQTEKQQSIVDSLNEENSCKSIAKYRSIQQSRPTVSLNYFDWAEQAFFGDSLDKSKNLLKILPVQLAVQLSSDYSPQTQNYIKERAKLINSLNNEHCGEEDYSSSLHSSLSPSSSYQNTPLPIQLTQTKKTISGEFDSRDKKQTQIIIPSASSNCSKQKSYFQPSNKTKSLTESDSKSEISQRSKLISNSYRKNAAVMNKDESGNQINQNKLNNIQSTINQNMQCAAGVAKYRLILQKNVIYNSASQKLEYLSQFFSTRAVHDFNASQFN